MNTPAHLVARALRDRRTIIWQYALNQGAGGSWRFHGLTRSQILKAVRRTPAGEFNYGVEYDPSRPPSTNGRYGLQTYTSTPPAPEPRDHDAVRTTYLRNEHDRVIHYVTQAQALLAEHGHAAAADQAQQLLHIVTTLTPKTA